MNRRNRSKRTSGRRKTPRRRDRRISPLLLKSLPKIERFGGSEFQTCRLTGHLFDALSIGGAVAGTGFAAVFKLADLALATDLSTVFDAYRFKGVSARFMPRNNVQSLTTTAVVTTAIMQNLIVAVDYDNAATPTLESISENSTARCHAGYEIVERTIVPRAVLEALGASTAVPEAVAPENQWLDMADTNIQHFGLKIFVTAGGGSQTTFQIWDVWFSYDLEFRYTQ
jgi:hypothetical protein